jgi:hypothetical protein
VNPVEAARRDRVLLFDALTDEDKALYLVKQKNNNEEEKRRQ